MAIAASIRQGIATIGFVVAVTAAALTATRPAQAEWSGLANFGCDGGRCTLTEACQSFANYLSTIYGPIGIQEILDGGTNLLGNPTAICRLDPRNGLEPHNDEITTLSCAAGEVVNLGRATGCQPDMDDDEEYGCPDDVGSPLVGNPCNPANGNNFEAATDYRSAGPDVLEFRRYYNSLHTLQSSFGLGWRGSFDRELHFEGGDTMHVRRPDGAVLLFTDPGGLGDWPPSPASGPDTVVRLVETGSGWRLHLPDDSVETYDLARRLTSIRQKNGYTQTIGYQNGRVSTVTDSHGRTLSFSYAETRDGELRLKTMTDPHGRLYEYGYRGLHALYNDSQLLNRVVYPDDTPADRSDNPRITYLYEHPYVWVGLTGIVDETGTRAATFTYHRSGPMLSSEHAGGQHRYQFSEYPAYTLNLNAAHLINEPKITNPLGRDFRFYYGFITSDQKIDRIARLSAAGDPEESASFEYDANGFPLRITDWQGNVTQ